MGFYQYWTDSDSGGNSCAMGTTFCSGAQDRSAIRENVESYAHDCERKATEEPSGRSQSIANHKAFLG